MSGGAKQKNAGASARFHPSTTGHFRKFICVQLFSAIVCHKDAQNTKANRGIDELRELDSLWYRKCTGMLLMTELLVLVIIFHLVRTGDVGTFFKLALSEGVNAAWGSHRE